MLFETIICLSISCCVSCTYNVGLLRFCFIHNCRPIFYARCEQIVTNILATLFKYKTRCIRSFEDHLSSNCDGRSGDTITWHVYDISSTTVVTVILAYIQNTNVYMSRARTRNRCPDVEYKALLDRARSIGKIRMTSSWRHAVAFVHGDDVVDVTLRYVTSYLHHQSRDNWTERAYIRRSHNTRTETYAHGALSHKF